MASVSNMEEAATIASEYVASLENLPNEVQFLLSELRLTDTRSHEIQLEINKESAKFFKQQLRGAGIGKDNVAAKIAADYATLSTLADEKRVLAERLAALVGRTRSRLDHDIQRMFTLTGEDPTLRTNYPSLNLGGPTPMSAVVENIRTALVPAEPVPAASVSVQPPPNKRRRPTVATPKQASPAPVSASSGRHGHGRARNSPMAPRRRAPVSEAMSEEIEDDERADDDPEEEDNRLYCFCQSKSFGEMIGCDNDNCKYQWFHLACVDLVEGVELPKNWYCPECVTNGFPQPQPKSRKGRKK